MIYLCSMWYQIGANFRKASYWISIKLLSQKKNLMVISIRHKVILILYFQMFLCLCNAEILYFHLLTFIHLYQS